MDQKTYVDSHAHLMAAEFVEDLPQIRKRIIDNNIDDILVVTTRTEEAIKAFDLINDDPNRYKVACGIHPEDVEEYNEEWFKRVEELSSDKRISAIGEIGLDYHWQPETKAKQIELFIKQIKLSNKVNKPILVHSRDASQDTFEILRDNRCRGVLHCYSGSVEMAKEYTKLGYYISLGGPVTFKNSRHAKEVAKEIDINYLLTETDCPYMAPEPVRGTRNEPSNIPYIVEVIAGIRDMSQEDVCVQIKANYHRLLQV